MVYKNSDELCEKMAEKQNGVTLLRFSTGKDAIAAYIQLKKFFDRIIPIYHYLHPDLEFVNKSLEYYESVFDTKIYRVPNQMLYKHLNSGLFQDLNSWKTILKFGLPNFDNDDVNAMIKDDLDLDENIYTALGTRAADSKMRGFVIKKHGAINNNRKTWLPVYDWKIDKLVSEIQEAGIKLPIDYKIWGKSFDGLDYRFIKPLKDNFPKDYEKLKQLFHLIDVEIKRYGY